MKLVIGIVVASVLILGVIVLTFDNERVNNSSDNFQSSQDLNTNTLEIGSQAPDFEITTIDSKKLTLSDFEDKILVITSGAAWCPTCIIENKNFKPVYEEIKNKNVEFITVDIDPVDSIEAIRDFQQKYAPWHNVHVSKAEKLISDYGFWRFEITYIIGPDGEIKFKDEQITNTETLRDELRKLL